MSNQPKYLYGASVQGIQGFIFQTSKLTEIVGASELVEQICTDFFKKEVGITYKEDNLILGAAGNIKYIFDDIVCCQQLVRKFPKDVMEMAPGLTISQAVVEIKDEIKEDDDNITQALENKLRIQRNKSISITNGVGLMVTETARKTGGVGVEYIKTDEVVDKAQYLKNRASNKANKKLITKIIGDSTNNIEKFPFDLSDMLDGEENNSWIAIIHADGNNLGQLIRQLVIKKDSSKTQLVIKNFSKILNSTTEAAAKSAYTDTVKENEKGKIPFRPVVLGGDDLTAIISADLALKYTKAFLKFFEQLSKANFANFALQNNLTYNQFENGLTACAGIAYIKATYPFHYGVSLAESLCAEAKRISKKIITDLIKAESLLDESKRISEKVHLTPSSLLFHKVHASFVEEYDDIIDAELTAKNHIQFNYGPYFVNEQAGYATIEKLGSWIKAINWKDAPKSGLRSWLTELKHNPENAAQHLKRIASLNPNYTNGSKDLLLTNPFIKRQMKKNDVDFEADLTPIFDIMELSNLL